MAVSTDDIEELNNRFLNFMSCAEDMEKAIEEIYEDLVDEVLMGFVFDVHRSLKSGLTEAEEGIDDSAAYAVIDEPGLDVFGESATRKNDKCSCPNCDNVVAANRFATHLERCLGMGRNSSRVASRRMQTNSKDQEQAIGSDEEEDDDWSQNKKRKRKNSKKQAKKLSANPKDDSDDVSTSNSPSDL